MTALLCLTLCLLLITAHTFLVLCLTDARNVRVTPPPDPVQRLYATRCAPFAAIYRVFTSVHSGAFARLRVPRTVTRTLPLCRTILHWQPGLLTAGRATRYSAYRDGCYQIQFAARMIYHVGLPSIPRFRCVTPLLVIYVTLRWLR